MIVDISNVTTSASEKLLVEENALYMHLKLIVGEHMAKLTGYKEQSRLSAKNSRNRRDDAIHTSASTHEYTYDFF